MHPVRTAATNKVYVGPPDGDIGDLPVVVADGRVTSVWELDGEERSQLDLGGRIALEIEGGVIPPMALVVVGPDCKHCGRVMQWSSRLRIWVCPHPDSED